MAQVSFAGVSKIYPDGTRAVDDLSIEVDDGELMVLVGPSGCGKTTALRMVAGLEEITEGEIRIGERIVNAIEPRQRDVAMVFQNYALYPHMSVFDNIAFPLRSRRLKKDEISTRVHDAASLLGLEEQLRRKPGRLSGGQRQRVAMGRAIVRQPQVFLMDEPLSNLDAKLRVQVRAEISKLQRDLGVTTIYVTHDQIEAMTMGTTIAVMRKGILQQHARPQALFDHPVNLFVATFIGSPAMNLVRARIKHVDDRLSCVFGAGAQRLDLPPRTLKHNSRLGEYRDRDVAVGIRPEHLAAATPARNGLPKLRGDVTLVETLGSEALVHVEIAAEPVITDEVIEIARDIDVAAVVNLRQEAAEHRVPIVARLESGTGVQPGDQIDLTVLPERLYLFDTETGNTIV